MRKIMLVNVTHVEESRVAILHEGVLAAYEIETINRSAIIGNIHNVVVENVLPSIEAAFVRLTADLKGFLPLDEVNFRLLPSRGESRGKGRIAQHLHQGQRLMAQVIREPFSEKPPTVTTYFSLPGRFLVLMPGVDSSGISRKIDDSKQRERLRKIVDELNPPDGFGIIVRTAGIGQTKTELQRDLRYLLRLWESIQRASAATPFPGLVYQERDLVIRTIRDYLTPDVDEVWIDSKDTYERALAFVRDVMPKRAKALRLYTGDRPLFNKFNLEEQIESIYRRRVPLPSGGEIVIDGTEALTAIDVNSARSTKKSHVEETALETNLEAAVEIARQLRLRDLGGLIVIDFIDMSVTRNKQKVERATRDALKEGKARYDITRISKLGLMEIARQRLKGEKMGASYTTCPSCDGYGLIKNVETAALSALRKLQTRSLRSDVGRIGVHLPPEVVTWMQNHKREELLAIERRNRVHVQLLPDPLLRRHESRLETFPREVGEQSAAREVSYRPSPAVAPDLKELAATETELAAPAEEAPVPTSSPAPAAEAAVPRRRRRRRKAPREAAESGDAAAVKPQAQPPTEAEESASSEDGREPTARRRRRRRRGRRGRGAAEGSSTSEGTDDNAARRVQLDELLPAASGRGDDARPRSPRARRKRSTG